MISVAIQLKAQFYDLDPMGMVWHGHYARYLEEARCALLDHIGYNYQQMAESGYLWPIVEMQLKYVRPLQFQQEMRITATLVEYENRARIDYLIVDPHTEQVITRARTTQVAVDANSKEMQLVSPAIFLQKVQQVLT
ncbi:acyl-CoA thioesterase [Candidatus Magnetaquicoccus inordinatus]|uniref:acyl-CoA thioesterase n=1 Tax=Candidatus Magnetaquicoccus inordinatus TaxID=2496818 RepID=UPI00102CBD37|nr:acyl-CoA thioesterase [Candidatus Magnetaquicoccus inordinatus]